MPEMNYSMAQVPSLAQKMSPQQYMASSLLQATVQDLRAELRQKLEANPAIEDVRWRDEPVLSSVVGDPPGGKSAADSDVPLDFAPDGEAAARTLSSEDGRTAEYMGNMESAPADDADERRLASVRENGSKADAAREERRQYLFDSLVAEETLDQHLLRQVFASDFSKEERAAAVIVLGNLDDSGYFVGSIPDIVMTSHVDERTLLSVQRRICSTFDPPGIAARDLRECLLAQMDRFDDSPWEDEVRAVVEHHLDDLVAGRFEKVRAELGLSEEEWNALKGEFRLFSRRPALQHLDASGGGVGRHVGPDEPQYIYPEIHAVRKNGRWRAVVTDGAIPKIVISRTYRSMADDSSLPADARAAIRGYVRDAEMLEDLLDERQDKLRRVAQAIIDAQPGFFEKGKEGLGPLSQSEIAKRVGLDDSTVSRAVNGKYMTTPFGTVELRSLFASGIATESGVVTPAQAKARIRALVAAEDPSRPLSDDAIAAKLNDEGFRLSRRTVAKYRDAERIPSSSQRRKHA